MQSDEIVDALNRNLEKEYGSVLLYIQISNEPQISKNKNMKKILSQLAEDEMRHAERLADRLAVMGKKSSWHIAQFERKQTLRENIIQIIKSEEDSIKEYTILIEELHDQPDFQQTMKTILAEEKGHKARAEALLKSADVL